MIQQLTAAETQSQTHYSSDVTDVTRHDTWRASLWRKHAHTM